MASGHDASEIFNFRNHMLCVAKQAFNLQLTAYLISDRFSYLSFDSGFHFSGIICINVVGWVVVLLQQSFGFRNGAGILQYSIPLRVISFL